ncbi:MAG: hypothetical protein EAZ92_13460 [Candidatus Kapaibacterium sp.]|nr:MAG: hypothetical protein EAZ92_13460 [Candidatus Kapabacteria bacterium]
MTLDIALLRSTLTGSELEQYWASCLEEYTEASSEERATLLAWVHHVRDGFLSHAADIDDEEELLVSVALSYIELKSKWQMLNTQVNYQVYRTGDAKPDLMFKSSLLSVIVDAIGKFLTDDDIIKIQEFLLNPTAEPLRF